LIEGDGPMMSVGKENYRPRLEVISVTHTWDNYQNCPVVNIELHIPRHLNASLKDLGWDK